MFAVRKKKPSQVGDWHTRTIDDVPSVSMIVPVYNEASVISRKIENLQAIDYPNGKMEEIYVDGGSTDGTTDLIRTYGMGGHRPVKIVEEGARRGFNIAVISGFREARGDIICVPGAETEWEPQALKLMVRHFADHNVGVVTGRQRVSNLAEGMSPKLEKTYREFYDFLMTAESAIDSPFDLKGEICATRRSIVSHLVERPEWLGRGAIDTAGTFQAKIDGYKAVFEPAAAYFERAPTSFYESFLQGRRRGAALIQNIIIFRKVMLNRRYGLFGTLIMPVHFCLLVILPFMFLVSVSGIVILAIFGSVYAVVCAGLALLSLLSKRILAFVKTQLVLVATVIGLFTRIETQKLKRLQSTRAYGKRGGASK
jgi:cellulose synthase/poly-beta-1,6-N-acetylglucosamine synthase-like glycosyltransferase